MADFLRPGEDAAAAPPGATGVVAASDPVLGLEVAVYVEPYSASWEAD